jgi:hypothetical protein
VAVVLTPVQTKQVRIYINETIQKYTVKAIQNTVNISTHITKTPTHSAMTVRLVAMTREIKPAGGNKFRGCF